jgi:glycosyltransferase involved in cell wall biosynthesis
MNPLVSVIIVTYNRSEYLCQSIDSALAQTYPHLEILVIDNGSTDQTENILKAYQDRIIYFKQSKQNLPQGRNQGLRLAKGKYIAFLDDDDLWTKQKIQKEVEYLEQHSDAGFVFSGAHYIDAEGNITGSTNANSDFVPDFESLYSWNKIISPSLALIRRQSLDETGHFDETLTQSSDYDLWLRLARKYKFNYLKENLSLYRRHPTSLSTNLERRILMHKRIFNKPEISRGKTWWQKRGRIAKTYYSVAERYSEQGMFIEAAGKFIESLLTWPFVGLYYWPRETDRFRFTFMYRILKVYGLVFWCFWKSFSSAERSLHVPAREIL